MSYLEQLKQTLPQDRAGNPLYPAPAGSGDNSLLRKLRLDQVRNIARAYEVKIGLDAPLKAIIEIMVSEESQGRFEGPPKRPYYFERARWNADQLKDMKSKGVKTIVPLGRWTGPDPDPPPPELEYHEKLSQRNTDRNKTNIISGLRSECKKRGLNSFGKGREELARMIAEHDGEMATDVVTAA